MTFFFVFPQTYHRPRCVEERKGVYGGEEMGVWRRGDVCMEERKGVYGGEERGVWRRGKGCVEERKEVCGGETQPRRPWHERTSIALGSYLF